MKERRNERVERDKVEKGCNAIVVVQEMKERKEGIKFDVTPPTRKCER
jgi:hypothetical protein